MRQLTRKIIVRYIIFLVFIAILPLLFIGIISYKTSSHTLQEAERSFSQALLSHQQEFLEIQLGQVESLIANISGVEAITQALDDRHVKADTFTKLSTQAQIGYILNGYLHLDGLVSIDIFTEGGAHYHVGDTLDISEICADAKAFIQAETIASGQQIYWAGLVPNINKASQHEFVLSAAHQLSIMDRATLQQRPLALLVVNYSIEHVSQHLSKIDLESHVNVVLLDQYNNTIYSRNSEDAKRFSRGVVAQLIKKQTIPKVLVWNEQTFFIHSQPLTNIGWQLLSITPENVLLKGVKFIGDITLLLLLIGFLVVGFSAWIFSRNIVQPIRHIIKGYQGLHEDALDTNQRLAVRSNDEIGQLIQWYNRFLDNLALQKISEKALRESEERYALVASATHEGLWDWNLLSNEMYFSPRFCALIGLDPRQHNILNRPDEWFKRIHLDDTQLVKNTIDRYISGVTPHFQCEHRLLHQDGSYRWILSHGLVVKDESGKALRMAGSHTDITDRKAAESKLHHYAYHDNLTGLKNRAWFVNHLGKVLNGTHHKKGTLFAVFFIDLDQFKRVNDTLGHAAGDDLLIQVAERIQKCLRKTDRLARLGGDEFVILLKQEEHYDVIHAADRILGVLSSPFSIQDQWVQTGASIGISFSDAGYTEPNDMLRDADIAMYQAKSGGKNRYVMFDENMRDLLLKHVALEQELAEAIRQGDLALFYQPIIDFKSGRLVGCEALLRWKHKTLGMISPSEFTSIAESSVLIHELGKWVLNAACQQWQCWSNEFVAMQDLKLSVNISAMQFHDDVFIESIPQVLAKYNIDGRSLAFEITETAIIQNTKTAANVINGFKALGISTHLDDFGTGFSSLSHLANFSIDLIKIDRSFVMQCTTHEKQKSMVLGILHLAHQLGIYTTAEGIETQAQWALLKNAQCDYAQGYYLHKPLSAEDMRQLLANVSVDV